MNGVPATCPWTATKWCATRSRGLGTPFKELHVVPDRSNINWAILIPFYLSLKE